MPTPSPIRDDQQPYILIDRDVRRCSRYVKPAFEFPIEEGLCREPSVATVANPVLGSVIVRRAGICQGHLDELRERKPAWFEEANVAKISELYPPVAFEGQIEGLELREMEEVFKDTPTRDELLQALCDALRGWYLEMHAGPWAWNLREHPEVNTYENLARLLEAGLHPPITVNLQLIEEKHHAEDPSPPPDQPDPDPAPRTS